LPAQAVPVVGVGEGLAEVALAARSAAPSFDAAVVSQGFATYEEGGGLQACASNFTPLGGCQRLRGAIVWYEHQRSYPWCIPVSEHRPAAARREWS